MFETNNLTWWPRPVEDEAAFPAAARRIAKRPGRRGPKKEEDSVADKTAAGTNLAFAGRDTAGQGEKQDRRGIISAAVRSYRREYWEAKGASGSIRHSMAYKKYTERTETCWCNWIWPVSLIPVRGCLAHSGAGGAMGWCVLMAVALPAGQEQGRKMREGG